MAQISFSKLNCVGLLQEKCVKSRVKFPEYIEISHEDDSITTQYKCVCKLQGHSTEGVGHSKKLAKHNAAEAMLTKITDIGLLKDLENKQNSKACFVLNDYCIKNNITLPVYKEEPKEDLFVFSCTFKDFKCTGKGHNKKEAKNNAADGVLKHFKLYEEIENYQKSKEQQFSSPSKNKIQILHELCQKEKRNYTFQEESILGNYFVTCRVGEHVVKSTKHNSKKAAKMEASELMINLLSGITPGSSPCNDRTEEIQGLNSESLVNNKRKVSDSESSEDETLDAIKKAKVL